MMFKKLHWGLTLLNAVITALILIVMSTTFLRVSESSQWNTAFLSFCQEMDAFVSNLKQTNIISHTWLKQISGNQYYIHILDNDVPYVYNEYSSPDLNQVFKEVLAYYDSAYPEQEQVNTVQSFHQEFTYTADLETSIQSNPGKCDYFVSSISILKDEIPLTVLVLAPKNDLKFSLFQQRIYFILMILCATIALTVFSWFFTSKLLKPIRNNQENQLRFVASASHELRAPLSVILSSAAVCEIAPKEEQKVFFSNIAQEGRRMQGLIRDMLLLANNENKQTTLQMDCISPDTLLLNIFEHFQPLATEKNITLSFYIPETEITFLYCNQDKIYQVLTILLQNAISYTNSGGCVKLSLEQTPRYTMFSVADTGCGIPKQERKRIFERFYRVESSHSSKEHFGLGLCIAKEIISAHKGTIDVTENIPNGSVFTISIPNVAFSPLRRKRRRPL